MRLAGFGIVPITVSYKMLTPEGELILDYSHNFDNKDFKGEHTENAEACGCSPTSKPRLDKIRFKFRRRNEAETSAARRDAALPGKPEPETPEEQKARTKEKTLTDLCNLLLEAPTGIEDWNAEGTLPEQIRRNFDNDDARTIANAAVFLYYEVVYPTEFL